MVASLYCELTSRRIQRDNKQFKLLRFFSPGKLYQQISRYGLFQFKVQSHCIKYTFTENEAQHKYPRDLMSGIRAGQKKKRLNSQATRHNSNIQERFIFLMPQTYINYKVKATDFRNSASGNPELLLGPILRCLGTKRWQNMTSLFSLMYVS